MADTPRVTLPVEQPLVDWFSQFIERHQEGCGSDTDALIACLDRVRDSYRFLSAAPAPEGGAVSDKIRVKYDQVKATTYRAGTPAERMKDGRLQGLNDALAIAIVAEDRAALATREEAPAEAGADLRAQVVKLLDELIAHIVAIGPDKPGANTPMSRRVWREVFADLIITRPAPDALRVAVGALREVSALRSNGHGDEWESGFTQGTARAADIADQALAALQAEQAAK